MKKAILLITLMSIIMLPQTYAFSFLGIDFSQVWDDITFWDNEEKPVEEQPQVEAKKVPTANQVKTTSNNKPKTPAPEIFITLAGTKYTQSTLKSKFSSNTDLQSYVQGFNYECVFIETDQGEEFTLNFNTEAGTLNSLKKGNSCEDKEIYLEESLLTDISQNGFAASEIKTYLEKVDLPWSMYGKAIKVFTVG